MNHLIRTAVLKACLGLGGNQQSFAQFGLTQEGAEDIGPSGVFLFYPQPNWVPGVEPTPHPV
ncbi:hypothetical protein DSO57_1023945 [Entomophthora muscae]|uniref:Uncharacterized protein n=1 Tax=Entomophthora muscae TaxID=34485 RepID=A0ACC2UCC6_9FUNG|nr:hypothetical protein DSO57_1023945 [Entomophthora muscae]